MFLFCINFFINRFFTPLMFHFGLNVNLQLIDLIIVSDYEHWLNSFVLFHYVCQIGCWSVLSMVIIATASFISGRFVVLLFGGSRKADIITIASANVMQLDWNVFDWLDWTGVKSMRISCYQSYPVPFLWVFVAHKIWISCFQGEILNVKWHRTWLHFESKIWY